MALTTDERPRARPGQLETGAGPAPFPPAALDAPPVSPTTPGPEAESSPSGFRRRRIGGFAVFAASSPAASVSTSVSGEPTPFSRVFAGQRSVGGSDAAYFAAKRVLDITATLILLTVLAPLLLLIALAIKLEDGGPMLYYQTRIGRSGCPFRFYKFRSMVRNADALKDTLIGGGDNEAGAVIFKMKRDPRCTRVGRLLRKYSLDELPQFFNVLKGEMSLVGPRPHLPREVAAYKEPRYHARNNVTPGLLCLREVQGRSNLTFEQWIALDLLYIEHQGMRTDLWILLRALPAILRAEGAY